MDFIGPLPRTKNGNTHTPYVVDKLFEMLPVIPLPDNYNIIIVASSFMEHVYHSQGQPDKIVSDHDTTFMSKFWKTLFSTLNVKISPSTAYHPQADGKTEIFNRKHEEITWCFVNYDKKRLGRALG